LINVFAAKFSTRFYYTHQVQGRTKTGLTILTP